MVLPICKKLKATRIVVKIPIIYVLERGVYKKSITLLCCLFNLDECRYNVIEYYFFICPRLMCEITINRI